MNSLINRRHLLLAATALASGCSREVGQFKGTDLTDVTYGRDFQLRDTQGRERTLADFRGKAVLLHFGFTTCADACPTKLQRAAQVRSMLGTDGERLQVLFFTLDPERDTPPVLGAYAAAFDPSFIGLYADLERTRRVADELKIFYRKVPLGDSYTLEHSTLSYAFDPDGRLRVGLRYSQSAEDCVHDLRQLLA